MSEGNSLFAKYHEVVHIWAKIQVFDQFSTFVLFKPEDSTIQKISPVGCFNLCH